MFFMFEDILKGNPLIVMEKTSYSIGDTLRGNCTAPASAPAANITFIVNGNKVIYMAETQLLLLLRCIKSMGKFVLFKDQISVLVFT